MSRPRRATPLSVRDADSAFYLVVVPPEQRAPILREYVRIASSGRQHFPLPVGAPLPDFEAIAGRYPVYRIDLS
jgi:hypothetical protein